MERKRLQEEWWWVETHAKSLLRNVNGLASAPNIQIVKLKSPSVKFHRGFVLYFSCIIFNSQGNK